MKRIACLALVYASFGIVSAQAGPEIDSWLVNTTGATGWMGLPANVESVQHSANNVYVLCPGIPEYDIGEPSGWGGIYNPAAQDYVFRIPRYPVEETGTKTATPLGHIGVWINGVPIYNALDGHSWNSRDKWHQNAVVVEADDFDSCLGHPAAPLGCSGGGSCPPCCPPDGGRYHHHQNPVCLYEVPAIPESEHSPILGFAFDGCPVYGPYAYANLDGTGGIKRMQTGYQLRDLAELANRSTLPDGTPLDMADWGPPLSEVPAGYFAEDFAYSTVGADLDEHNGRFAVTPEYPAGTYAYYVTINGDGSSAYPYAIGPEYNCVVDIENFGVGRVEIDEPVLMAATEVGNDVTTRLNIYIRLKFDAVYQSGETTLSIHPPIVPLPANIQPTNPPTFFEITTTAQFTGPIQIRVSYEEGSVVGDEADLRLFRLDESVQPAQWRNVSAALDVTQNLLYGRAAALGQFAVATSATAVGTQTSPRSTLMAFESYPNPFNPATTVRFELGVDSPVSMTIYDSTGRKVRALLNRTLLNAGEHWIVWDGADDLDRPVGSGVYFCRVVAGDQQEARRMALIK